MGSHYCYLHSGAKSHTLDMIKTCKQNNLTKYFLLRKLCKTSFRDSNQ